MIDHDDRRLKVQLIGLKRYTHKDAWTTNWRSRVSGDLRPDKGGNINEIKDAWLARLVMNVRVLHIKNARVRLSTVSCVT